MGYSGFRVYEIEVYGQHRVDLVPRDRAPSSESYTSILIGNNGTGKSRALAAIAEAFLALTGTHTRSTKTPPLKRLVYGVGDDVFELHDVDGSAAYEITRNGEICSAFDIEIPSQVIALTVTPFDKFPVPRVSGVPRPDVAFDRANIYSYLGLRDRTNRASSVAVFYRLIENLSVATEQGHERNTKIASVFDLLGYEPRISIKYKLGSSGDPYRSEAEAALFGDRRPAKRRAADPWRSSIERSISDLRETMDETQLLASYRHIAQEAATTRSLRIEFDFESFRGSYNSNFVRVLHGLRRAWRASIDSVVLYKKHGGGRFDLRTMSSGEIGLVVTIIAAASAIHDNSLVLIDEPEISLHPAWQSSYLDTLLRCFEAYKGCHYVIATHSPMIVSDISKWNSSIVSLDPKPIPDTEDLAGQSVDALLVNAFHVVGNDSLYVKEQILHALRLLSDGKVHSREFSEAMNALRSIRTNVDRGDAIAGFIDQLERAREIAVATRD